jgi:hypothetical protein
MNFSALHGNRCHYEVIRGRAAAEQAAFPATGRRVG